MDSSDYLREVSVRFFVLIFTLLFTAILVTGCGGDSNITDLTPASVTSTPTPTPTPAPVATDMVLLQAFHDVGESYDNSALVVPGVTDDPIDIATAGMVDSWDVVVSPDGKNVYYTSDCDVSLLVFSRDATTGKLTLIQSIVDEDGDLLGAGTMLNTPTEVKISADGNYLYMMDWGTGKGIFVFERTNDNSVDHGKLTAIQHIQDSDLASIYLEYDTGNSTFAGLGASISGVTLTISPDGKQLYAAGYNGPNGTLVHFDIVQSGGTKGQLIPVGFYMNGRETLGNVLSGIWDMEFSPDGNYLFLTAESGDTLTVFSRNSSDGKLTYEKAFLHNTVYNGVTAQLDSPEMLAFTPSGDYVFVQTGVSATINIFKVVGGTDILELKGGVQDSSKASYGAGWVSMQGIGGYDLVFSPDGKSLYATGRSNAHLAFDWDGSYEWDGTNLSLRQSFSATGLLSNTGVTDIQLNGIDFSYMVDVSPDGQNVYFTSMAGYNLHVFKQNYE